MAHHFKMAVLAIFLSLTGVASAVEIVPGVSREKDTVLINPCDLKFSISDKWVLAPKEVFNAPNQQAFMMGRLGLKDKKGHEVIPTIGVIWQQIDYVEMDPKKGQDVDPLFLYTLNNRPDFHSKDYKLEKIFFWQDGPLTLRYATGWQYSVELKGRPSKIIAVYTINKGKKLGIQIFLEIPEDVWPEIKDEVESILKSFDTTSSTFYGK